MRSAYKRATLEREAQGEDYMPGEKELNLEELAKQDALTEEQVQQIHKDAYKDEDKKSEEKEEPKEERETPKEEESEEKEPGEEKEEKSEEELLNSDEKDLSDGEKAQRQELLDRKAQEEQELIEASDDQLSDEQKEQKQELIKTREEEKSKSDEQRVKDYAEQNEMSAEDAKKEIKQIDEIKSRYEGDLDKVAKSNLYLQKMSSKAKNELKRLSEASRGKEVTPEQIDKLAQNGELMIGKKAFTKEALIKIARNSKEWNDVAETMDDEPLYKLIVKDLAKRRNESIKEQGNKAKQVAETKRVECIKQLANYPNKFYDDAKAILEKVNDNYIASEYFDVKHIVTQVKGSRYDKDVKEAEEKAYKRGLEKAKVLEKKPPVGEGKTKKKAVAGSVANKLSPQQKQDALSMYESVGDKSDEWKFRKYMEIYPEEFKNKGGK